MILPAHTPLYRYDIQKPPSQWSVDFHEYYYDCKGYKNMLGAFFFYDNKENPIQTCRNDEKFEGICFLTQCETVKEINLLDLRAERIMGMLEILFENGINILVPELNTFSQCNALPLSGIALDFEDYLSLKAINVKTNKDIINLSGLVQRITRYIEPRKSNLSFRFFGQLLTDFENGPIFKQMLLKNGFDGYVFYEHDEGEPCVTTYCIFDNMCLSSPECQQLRI